MALLYYGKILFAGDNSKTSSSGDDESGRERESRVEKNKINNMGCFAWKIKAEKKNIFKDLIQMTWQGLKLLNYHSTKRPSFIIIVFITTMFESPINGL